MNLRQMEVLHAIMVTGSVTGAAKLLNVSQPAVSATLRHCEDNLGLKLFERSGGRLQPTPEAHALYPDIASIFRRVDKLGELSRDLAGGKLGTVSIAASFPLMNGWVTNAIARFSKTHPNVRFFLQTLTTQVVVDRVLTGEIDLGLCFARPLDSTGLIYEPLFKSEITCVFPKGHPRLEPMASVSPADLDGERLVTYTPQSLLRTPIDEIFAKSGREPSVFAHVDLSLTALRLVEDGFGVALVDSWMVGVLGLEALSFRPLNPRVVAEASIIRLKNTPVSRATATFIEELKQEAAGMPC